MKTYFYIFIIVSMMFSGALVFANSEKEVGDAQGQPQVLKTTGPAGDDPVDYTKITISDTEIKQAQKTALKIAVLMHTSSDFTNAVVTGVKDTAKKLGAKVVLVTDAEFDANKQKTDIENALVLNPDIIIILVLDGVSGAAALRPAIDKGVKIALLSNLPSGFVHGKDYTSIVTDDLFNMGKSMAEMMGDDLGGKGKVGLLYHDANYYVTNQRDRAVKTVLVQKYPKIKIVAERGIANPSDGEVVASALLTQYPNIQAIYAPWDAIAEGVLAAARSSNRKDLKVYTMDLGGTTVLDMAKGGNISGIVADLPYELGVTLTKVGVLGKLGKETPSFVTVPAIKVSKDTIEAGWKKSLKRDLPIEVTQVLSK